MAGEWSVAELLNESCKHPGSIIAWKADAADQPCLSLFTVDETTTQLAVAPVPGGQLASVSQQLRAHGLFPGAYASTTDLVWLVRGDFSVWGAKGLIFHTDGKILRFARDQIPFNPGMRVAAFLADDWICRGVQIIWGAARYTVAEHRQLRALLDWSYGGIDALSDCGWAVILGSALADFLGVEFVDHTG
jgi:hypothetical protein